MPKMCKRGSGPPVRPGAGTKKKMGFNQIWHRRDGRGAVRTEFIFCLQKKKKKKKKKRRGLDVQRGGRRNYLEKAAGPVPVGQMDKTVTKDMNEGKITISGCQTFEVRKGVFCVKGFVAIVLAESPPQRPPSLPVYRAGRWVLVGGR